MNKFFKNPLIKGTIILTAAGLFTRILGFYYRIFLNSHIGAYGMGMLQLIMPLCGIAFSICMCGFNSAISKYTASSKKSLKPLISGLMLSVPLSLLFSLICYIFSNQIATELMLNPDCAPLIKILSFSIPLSAIHSCICGYYYGCKETAIPAVSQITEQFIRITGIILYYHLFVGKNDSLNISDVLYGNIAGELVAVMLSTAFLFKKNKNSANKISSVFSSNYIKNIFFFALPLNLNSLLIHLLESSEAILIPAELMLSGMNNELAVSTYGVLFGMALPLIMFPSAITNSLSVMLLPKVSEDNSSSHIDRIADTISSTITLCMHLGIICTALFILYISRLGAIIFNHPDVYTYTLMLSFVCPFMYVKISLSSILNGINKTSYTCATNVIGLLIRIGFLIFLVPRIRINGYIYGLIISNVVTCILNYIRLKSIYNFRFSLIDNIIMPISITIISLSAVKFIDTIISSLPYQNLYTNNYTFHMLINLIFACFIYLIIYLWNYKRKIKQN